jgi:hypothetical protein
MKLSAAEIKVLIEKGATLGPPVGDLVEKSAHKLPPKLFKIDAGRAKPVKGKITSILVKCDGLKIESTLNKREHWAARAKRGKDEAEAVLLALVGQMAFPGKKTCTLTRHYMGRAQKFDDDNLAGGFKAIRDTIAEWLLCDDGDGTVEWIYRQERAAENAVVIAIQRRES